MAAVNGLASSEGATAWLLSAPAALAEASRKGFGSDPLSEDVGFAAKPSVASMVSDTCGVKGFAAVSEVTDRIGVAGADADVDAVLPSLQKG